MQTEENKNQNFFQSNTAKMLMVGLLTLVLLIPLVFVQNLIQERSERKNGICKQKNILFSCRFFSRNGSHPEHFVRKYKQLYILIYQYP